MTSLNVCTGSAEFEAPIGLKPRGALPRPPAAATSFADSDAPYLTTFSSREMWESTTFISSSFLLTLAEEQVVKPAGAAV